MATENRMLCLLGAMDRLWFHQIILLQEQPSLFLHHEITKPPLPTSEIPTNPSSRNSSQASVITEQQISPAASVNSAPPLDETSSQESDDHDHDKETAALEFNRAPSKTTSSSSSSPLSAHEQSRNVMRPNSTKRLRRCKSCKSLEELELAEVKGFMDLGFTFKKGSLNERMMSLIPGLQRLDSYDNDDNVYDGDSEDAEEEDEEKGVMRPYLSEAWLVKRPDSPLLNLRMPRVSTAADMKKHLKCWARTVASAIQLES